MSVFLAICSARARSESIGMAGSDNQEQSSPERKGEIETAARSNFVSEELNLSLLPHTILSEIVSFIDLDDFILYNLRGVCVSIQEACDMDSRWLPAIAPPSLATTVLSLDIHGFELRRLYKRYRKWYSTWQHDFMQDREEHLRSKQSALDGFFSLAPWRHPEDSSSSYPIPWLHLMVYGKLCPTTTGSKRYKTAQRSARKKQKQVDPDKERSLFFHQRIRDAYQFRIFFTYPIKPWGRSKKIIKPWGSSKKSDRRVLIQPVNFRHEKDGSKHKLLPDHDPAELSQWNYACAQVLDCYFGKGNVIIAPLVQHQTNLKGRQYYRRSSVTRDPQVNAEALVGLRRSVLDTHKSHHENELNEENCAIIYVIAPHMYHIDAEGSGKHYDWMYGTYLDDEGGIDAGVLSIFQMKQCTRDDSAKQLHAYVCMTLATVLKGVIGEGCCESRHCAMNNSDSMDEMIASAHLVVCPVCIRKLQFCGVLDGNIPSFFARLYAVLSQGQLKDVCKGDALKLKKYGGAEGG